MRHAKRGVSGALNLQSATAGSNSRFEAKGSKAVSRQGALISESCAIRDREPCQVLTEAALSDMSGVPRGCSEVATCIWFPLVSVWSILGCVTFQQFNKSKGIYFLPDAAKYAALKLGIKIYILKHAKSQCFFLTYP